MPSPRVFWDSSALIAAIMARSASASGPALLKAGEAGVIEMVLSHEVISDVERAIGSRRPDLLPNVQEIIATAGLTVVPDGSAATIKDCFDLTGYRPDARVLAAAVECGADLLLTLDSTHFLGNPLIGPPATHVRVVTPAEALALLPAMLSRAT